MDSANFAGKAPPSDRRKPGLPLPLPLRKNAPYRVLKRSVCKIMQFSGGILLTSATFDTFELVIPTPCVLDKVFITTICMGGDTLPNIACWAAISQNPLTGGTQFTGTGLGSFGNIVAELFGAYSGAYQMFDNLDLKLEASQRLHTVISVSSPNGNIWTARFLLWFKEYPAKPFPR